jgi:hypothetical protein
LGVTAIRSDVLDAQARSSFGRAVNAVRRQPFAADELEFHPSGWPAKWTFGCEERKEFIEQIRWFSSNYAPQFGRLLTPLVDGIRILGPLFPTFTGTQPKLVLLDGQGRGTEI